MEKQGRLRLLARSAGSFALTEENILAPTPRKISTVPISPIALRREKSEELFSVSRKPQASKELFGEAGQEIQTILFNTPFKMEGDKSRSVPPRVQVNVINPSPSPPLRAANPMTLNTPFHPEELLCAVRREKAPPSYEKQTNDFLLSKKGNKRPEEQQTTTKNQRFKSRSWPGQ